MSYAELDQSSEREFYLARAYQFYQAEQLRDSILKDAEKNREKVKSGKTPK